MSAEMAVMDSYINGDPIIKSLLQKAEEEHIPRNAAEKLVSALTAGERSVLNSLTMQYNRERVCEPLITRDVMDAASSSGAKLDGLVYSAKTGNSVGDKLARSISGASLLGSDILMEDGRGKFLPNPDRLRSFLSHELQDTKDLVRYTEIVGHDDIPDKTLDLIKKMEEKGYIHCSTKNYYTNPFPGTGYMGMHTNFISPYGQIIEIQIHSEESFAAKQKGHALYEELRGNYNGVEDKEKKYAAIREIHQSVPLPAGYEKVADMKLPYRKMTSLAKAMKIVTDVQVKKVKGKNDLQCTLFSVRRNGEEKLNGFDVRFPEGDSWAYRKDSRDADARFESIRCDPRSGGVAEMSVLPQKPVTFDLSEVMRIAEKWMDANTEWLKEHFPHGYTLDELDQNILPGKDELSAVKAAPEDISGR